MSIIKKILDTLESTNYKNYSLLPYGILLFLGYYDLVAALKVPFYFTINRVTNLIRLQLPLLGSVEFDVILYSLISLTILVVVERNKKNRVLYAMLTVVSIVTFLTIFTIGRASNLSLFIVGIGSLATLLLSLSKNKLYVCVYGFISSIALLEICALIGYLHYYSFGTWLPFYRNLVLKERLFWAPFEILMVMVIIVVSLNHLIKFVTGRTLYSSILLQKQVTVRSKNSYYPLIVSLILITLLVFLPHLPTVNPENSIISVDTEYYEEFFNLANQSGIKNAVSSIPARPVYLYFLWFTSKLFSGNTRLFLEVFHPIISLAFLAFSTFYTCSKMSDNDTAGIASLLLPLGYSLTGFLGGGFQANSLALSIAVFSLSFKPNNMLNSMRLCFLLSLTGLIHPWTQLMYMAFLLLTNIKHPERRGYILSLLIASYLIVNGINHYLISEDAYITAFSVASGNLSFNPIESTNTALRFWVWNTLSNPILFFPLLLQTVNGGAILYSLLFPLLLIGPAFLQYRMILNLPSHILVAEKLSYIKKNRILIYLILLTRVIGNISGLTPL